MPFDPISWGIGFALNASAKAIVDLVRNQDLRDKLSAAVVTWAREVPSDKWLEGSALFPELGYQENLASRPSLARIRSALQEPRVPDESEWRDALLEQWRKIAAEPDMQPFFQISEAEASTFIAPLASRLRSICVEDEAIFKETVIRQLRYIREKERQKSDAQLSVERLAEEFENIVFDLLHSLDRLSTLVRDGVQNDKDGLRLQSRINDLAWAMRAKADQICGQPIMGKASNSLIESVSAIYVEFRDLINGRGGSTEPLKGNIARFQKERGVLSKSVLDAV